MAEKIAKTKGPDEKVLAQTKDASIDMPFKVKSLGKLACSKDEGDPYHEEGDEFIVGEKKAKELKARGWVDIVGPVDFVQPALSTEEK